MRSRDRLRARRPRGWTSVAAALAAPLVLAIVAGSCAGAGAGSPEASASIEPRTELQRRSLATVFFAGGEPPPALGRAERAELRRRRAAADSSELRELRGFVPDRALQLLAIRDSDGDGVHDYRISDYYGKFMEGDIDVDGDGIRNSLDAAPYDRAVGGSDVDGDGAPDRDFDDGDGDGIPDHADWSGLKDEPTARLQEDLFRHHQVLLVERSAPFTAAMARSAHDAVTRVFRGPLAAGALPALRLIATDETCLLSPELDDETNAMVVPQTQTLLIYRVGLDYPPIAQLGLLAHELSHAWQFSLDFDASDLAAENRRVYSPSPAFRRLIEPLGWTGEEVDYDPEAHDYRLFTPQYFGLEPNYRYRDKTPDTWAAELDRLYERLGEDYLAGAEVGDIVGDYSLTSPGEWHADNLLAYLYTTLERRVADTYAPREAEETLATLYRSVVEAWPRFRYRNFDRARLAEHYERYFPLAETDLDHLIETYLRPAVRQPTSSPASSPTGRQPPRSAADRTGPPGSGK